jgi:hypothetical protein
MRLKDSAAQTLPRLLVLCLLFSGCLAGVPTTPAPLPGSLSLPASIQVVEGDIGTGGYRIEGPLTEVGEDGSTDQVLRWTLHAGTPEPESLQAYWSLKTMQFVRYGIPSYWIYNRAPEQALMVPYLVYPYLLSVGMTLGAHAPSGDSFTGERFAQWIISSRGPYVIDAKGDFGGNFSVEVRFDFADDSLMPIRITLLWWAMPWKLPITFDGPDQSADVRSAQAEGSGAVRFQWPRPDLPSNANETPTAQPVWYATSIGSGFWGPPKDSHVITADFPLHTALSAVAQNPQVAQYLNSEPNAFVWEATRTTKSSTPSTAQKPEWNVAIGPGCARTSPSNPPPPLLRVKVQILEAPNPLGPVPVVVDVWESKECDPYPASPSWTNQTAFTGPPWVSLDSILQRVLDEQSVTPSSLLNLWYGASMSCLPASSWRIQMGVHQPGRQGLDQFWYSLVDGKQTAAAASTNSPVQGFTRSFPSGVYLECPPSAPAPDTGLRPS